MPYLLYRISEDTITADFCNEEAKYVPVALVLAQRNIRENWEKFMRSDAAFQKRLVTVKLSIDRHDLTLIDIAAKMQGARRVGFIIEAAFRRAEEVILDAHTFLVAPPRFDAFEAALESNSLEGNRKLAELLERPSRWG